MRRRLVLLSMMVALAAAGTALAQPAIPEGGVPLLAADPLTALRTSSSRGSSQLVDADGPGFSRAIRVSVTAAGNPWDVELSARIVRPVQRGESGLLMFYARAAQPADEAGDAYFTVYAQKASPDWSKAVHHALAVGPGWQLFTFPFAWNAGYDASQSMLAFGMGSREQVVDIGGVVFLGYGMTPLEALPQTQFSYGGREADAPWRAEAAARIEAIRKGPLVVEVTDRRGEPLDRVEVRIEQRRHRFPFGSALTAARLTSEGEDSAAYRQKVAELFNAASLENDTKWPPWEGDWGPAFNVPQTLAALDWLKARGFEIRGHVLVWPGWSNLPRSITALRGHPEAAALIPPAVLAHIDEVTQRTASYMHEWDVVNEPFTNHDLMDLAGNEIMRDWFQQARRNLPEAGLYLNEYDILARHGAERAHQDHFEQTARFLLEAGAPITGLGMQGHFGSSPTSIDTVKRVLDRFAQLGLAIRITEFDFNTDDEQLQADYTRDFLTMIFSHPAVAGFQMWGFWEGAHWLPKGAMYRRDWSEKPNGDAFRRLVHETWRTLVEGSTDRDGVVSTRAFFGRYEVAVTRDGVTRRFEVDHAPSPEGTRVRVEF